MGIRTTLTLLCFSGILIFAVSGCSSTNGNQSITDPDKLHKLVIGKTTEKQVKELFGDPEQTGVISGSAFPTHTITITRNGVKSTEKITADEQFDSWTYTYSKSSSSESPLNFIPWASMFGHTDTKSDTGYLFLYFDHNGVLTFINQNKGTYKCQSNVAGSNCS